MTQDALVDGVFGRAAATIRSTFRAMEIAEEEITAAKERHPLASTAIHEAFRFLCPNDLLRGAGDRLYSAHCRELLDRVAVDPQRPDLSEPTAAELCAALSQLSLGGPLTHDYTVAFGDVFRRAFPDAEAVDSFADLAESYPGRTDEVLREITQKIRRFSGRSNRR